MHECSLVETPFSVSPTELRCGRNGEGRLFLCSIHRHFYFLRTPDLQLNPFGSLACGGLASSAALPRQ